MLGEIIHKLLQGEEVEESKLENLGLELVEIFKNFRLVDEDSKFHTIDLMLEGRAYASREGNTGQNILARNILSPQFFCLIELLGGRDKALATIIATEKCKILRIPVEVFEDNLLHDAELTKIALKYLGTYASDMLEEHSITYGFSYQYNILKYFYDISTEEEEYVLDMNKDFLADMFHVNVRTLYRYLTEWENDGYILRKGQNIIIHVEGRKKIEKFLEAERSKA